MIALTTAKQVLLRPAAEKAAFEFLYVRLGGMTMFEEYEFRTLQIDQHGPLAVLTVNRQGALNALNGETLSELAQVTDIVAENAEIAVLIVTGGGDKAFVAGADIGELTQLEGVFAGREMALAGQDVMHGIATLPIPTIAAINGYALGGGLELALACDVRVASRTARLGLPESGLGLLPGFGGTQRLPRLIGAGRALDLMLTTRQVQADEALSMGLVNYLADDALQKAREVAEQMLKNAPISLSLIKEAVRRGLDTTLELGLEIEADLFGMTVATLDFKEGTQAFLGKRKASFKGE
jgi:enoyl-CoA hydratase